MFKFCSLRDVVEALAIGPQDVNSWNFNNELTPLHLASQEGHLDIAQFLVEHSANAAMAVQDQGGSRLLWVSSASLIGFGRLQTSETLNAISQGPVDQSWTADSSCHGLPPFLPNLFFLFVYLTPDRFSLAYLNYLWTVLAFSRDFHMIPWPSISFHDLPLTSMTFW